ncbi:MAG: cobyrinate a,c-diamide synthase [Chloroflexi bacterium]|nr:cobyrinate a,c-diamide synthase [Chloroflexota bacterium]
MTSPRFLLAAPASSTGKTTIMVGLIAAIRRRGLKIQPFKAGPDYIDPGYHTLAAGRSCRNLDTWMIPPEHLSMLFHHHAQKADISIIEGVMGLFDGQNYLNDAGSTAQIAKKTGTPVILILDAARAARSMAAIALGFQKFDPDLHLAGFIINFVAGENHGQGVSDAIEEATGLPVLGWLPRNPTLAIPERHLGLIPTAETGQWDEFISAAEKHISRYLDLDTLLELAQQAKPAPTQNLLADLQREWQLQTSSRPIIAVARDEAFNFIYEENLDLLRAAGAEIVFFSPLKDKSLPAGTSGIILSGGFPEIYAEKLSVNDGMRQALQSAHKGNLPIYAECGGLMVLTESITDLDGQEFPMFALLPGKSLMTKKLNMGYRQAQAVDNSWLLKKGEEIRGHEFHYSTWENRPDDLPSAYSLISSRKQDEPYLEGASFGSLWASYVHLPFWNKPELALRFVESCRERMHKKE